MKSIKLIFVMFWRKSLVKAFCESNLTLLCIVERYPDWKVVIQMLRSSRSSGGPTLAIWCSVGRTSNVGCLGNVASSSAAYAMEYDASGCFVAYAFV